jgi:hypothetical protein
MWTPLVFAALVLPAAPAALRSPTPKPQPLQVSAPAEPDDKTHDDRPWVGLSLSIPRAVFRVAVAQLEVYFSDSTSLALQGGWGKPVVTRGRASSLTVPLLDVGLQLRGWFTGSPWDGGFFGGLAAEYAHATESGHAREHDAFGGGLVLGYKWTLDRGPFIDLNGGAGYGYMGASGADGLTGRGISVFPFANLNVGWTF